jgi:hypothetical protein
MPVWFYDHMLRLSRLRLSCHPSHQNVLRCHRWATLYLNTIPGWSRAGMLHMMHDVQTRTYLDAGKHVVAVSFASNPLYDDS